MGEARPRLAVVDGLAVITRLDDVYLGLKALSGYSGCSVRWLRDRLTDPVHPLPAYRLPGSKVLIRRSEFDHWMARYRQVGNANVERIVTEALRDL